MRKFILAATAALLCTLGGGTVYAQDSLPHASSPLDHQANESTDASGFEWTRWGGAPAYASMDAACADLANRIDASRMPDEVKTHFKEVAGTTCKGFVDVWLTPGKPFEQMSTRDKNGLHFLEKVTEGTLPVIYSPDGRKYQQDAVAQTAKARELSYEFKGEIYLLDIPYECFNTSWGYGDIVTVVVNYNPCAEITYRVPVGTTVRFAVGSLTGPLAPNECSALKQGTGDWQAWSGQCDTCSWYNVKFLREQIYYDQNAKWYHETMYTATTMEQTLRFPRSVTKQVVVICLEYTDPTTGQRYQSEGEYVIPKDWNGKTLFDIGDDVIPWHKK